MERRIMKASAWPRAVKRFFQEVRGVTVSEYAVCLALIIVASIGAVTALGVVVSELFPDLAECF